MKNIGKLAVLGAVLAASASFAFADTIGSYASVGGSAGTDINGATTVTGYLYQNFGNGPTFTTPGFTTPPTGNLSTIGDPTGSSYTLIPGTTWAPGNLPNSTWVGYSAAAGPGGSNPPQGFYTFTTTFSTVGAESGMLNVYSDDTVEVFLNGTLLANELIPFGNLGGDTLCAAGVPNCVTEDSVALNVTGGSDTLTFVVLQAGNENSSDPSGLDFDGTISATPEPSSLMLLGSGLVGAAGMFFRRRQTV